MKARVKTEGQTTRKEGKDDCLVEFGMRARIVTVEDAIKHGEINLDVWYVDRFEVTSWEMGYKDAAKSAHILPLWRVKLYLKRIRPKALHEASEMLFDRLSKIAPDYRTLAYPSRLGRPLMMELDLWDSHFGKLAWKRETGEDYDLDIAQNIYRNAIEDLIGQASGFKVEQIVFPLGNDFFHYDNFAGQTTAGTQMDVDSRFAKMIEIGEAAVLQAIDYVMRIAPVKVIWVPGNHDRQTSYHLCRTVKTWYRNTPHVTVDVEPATRKINHYGCNLTGFIHADKVSEHKVKNLPDILKQMGLQAGIDLREIKCYEFHMGHVHYQKAYMTKDLDTLGGTAMRWLASLSGVDAWHFENLFVNARRVAEAYFYDKTEGFAGFFNTPARQSA